MDSSEITNVGLPMPDEPNTRSLATPVIAVVTKTDLASKDRIGEQLLAVSALADWADVVPTSAVDGFQVQLLADLLVARLPAGPALLGGATAAEPQAGQAEPEERAEKPDLERERIAGAAGPDPGRLGADRVVRPGRWVARSAARHAAIDAPPSTASAPFHSPAGTAPQPSDGRSARTLVS